MREQPPLEEPFSLDEPSLAPGGVREASAQMEARSDEVKTPSFISKLFPPPPTLIKDSLSRYKTAEAIDEGVNLSKEEKLEDMFFEPPPPLDDLDSEDKQEPPFED